MRLLRRSLHGEQGQFRGTWHVRGRRDDPRDLPDLRGPRSRGASLHAQGPPGEPAAHRGRCECHSRPDPHPGCLGSGCRAHRRDPVHPGAGDHAGLHRCPVRRGPRHHARGHEGPRGRPGEDQPAGTRGARHRPLGHRRLLRHPRLGDPQCRPRVRAQPGALPVPALGPDGVRRVQGRSAGHRHRAPGQHRVTRACGHGSKRAGLPGHLRGHRLAHDDGQRPGCARLGRGWHRGRGRDARPAGEHADPPGRRVQADRRAAPGRDRHRHGPDDHRDPAQARRRGQVRGVLRGCRRRRPAGQPRHDRQHEPRVRLDGRDLPDRRRDPALPAPDRALRGAGRPRRGLLPGAGPLARPVRRGALHERHRAGPRHDRAVAGRPEASAGPRGDDRCQGGVPGSTGHLHGRSRRHRDAEHRGAGGDDRSRSSRDRRDHLVHEHVEPVGDDGGRTAGPQCRRARVDPKAVGQDHARPGVEGRLGLLRPLRADPLPRQARLRHRRLRLHDVHRQLGPAARGGVGGRERPATSRSSPSCRATATSRAGSTRT